MGDVRVNEFGEALQRLIEKKGLRGPEDLERLLEEAGHPMPAREIRERMEGTKWMDEHLPRLVVQVLRLSVEEMGVLARAVAYGQIRPGQSCPWIGRTHEGG
jgi:hypothetical protein